MHDDDADLARPDDRASTNVLTPPSNRRQHEPMRTILSIQSHVVYGHVGNSAAAFPLQRLGCEVWPIHTVQFSSHAGYPGWRGKAFDADLIDECVAGLRALGVLERCDGVLSGYLGRPEIGEAALRALGAVRGANANAIYACDPVIGDVGRGVYVASGVGEFFRERALPRATILTPNAFELEWLTGLPVASLLQVRAALAALHSRGPKVVLVTSLALEDTPADALDMLASDGEGLWRVRTPRLPIAVNGAGDLTAALFFFHWLRAGSAPEALASAAASVYGVVAATAEAGQRELAIVAAQDQFVRPTRLFRPEPL
jgi:pyridoxine kinase